MTKKITPELKDTLTRQLMSMIPGNERFTVLGYDRAAVLVKRFNGNLVDALAEWNRRDALSRESHIRLYGGNPHDKRWNRKSAEQAVTFYTGLIERGAPLTVEEKKDLTGARQFLRMVRKGTRNPSKKMKSALPDDKAYRGYLIRHNLVGDTWIEKDGIRMAWSEDEETAKRIIDSLIDPVIKWTNPPAKLIYGNVEQIKATKQAGRYRGQKFFHDFKPGAQAYGLDNGDILITTRKLK